MEFVFHLLGWAKAHPVDPVRQILKFNDRIFYLITLIPIFALSKGNGVLPYPTALQKLMTPD